MGGKSNVTVDLAYLQSLEEDSKELERLREKNTALEARIALLKEKNDELKDEIDRLRLGDEY